MQRHQYVDTCFQKDNRNSFVGKIFVNIILGLIFLGTVLIANVSGVQAYAPAVNKLTYSPTTPSSAIEPHTHTASPSSVDKKKQSVSPILVNHTHTQAQKSSKTAAAQPAIAQPAVAQAATKPSYSTTSVTLQQPSQASSDAAIEAMINQVFGPYGPAAINIAKCESSLNPNAYNGYAIGGSHAAGLFQILYPSTWNGTSQAANSPYNAQANTLAAHEIFVRDGYSWREWACQP